MAYQIDRYNNTLLTVVEDGTIDQTTDLKFIGKNYAGYGEIQNENFLYLLENFSGANQPARPLSGQIWFDSANSKLKFYDGTKFRTTGGAEVSDTQPTGLALGDFWWDTANDQLYVYNGTDFILIGPQAAGEGVTQMRSIEVLDTTGTTRSIIAATVEDEVVFVISPYTNHFDLNATTPVTGFDRIRQGVTLAWTRLADNGVTNSTDVAGRNFYYWGTASNAEKFDGLTSDAFVRSTNVSFADEVRFGDAGLFIGDSQDLQLYIENGNEGVVQNGTGSNSLVRFKTTDGTGTLTNIFNLSVNGLIPSEDSRFDLGTASFRWRDMYANNYYGEAEKAASLRVGSVFRTASVGASNDTVAVRDATGNLAANLFEGTATKARYADLAEKYTTGKNLAPGTVVCVSKSDEYEVEPVRRGSIAIGVVSTDPAIMMNSDSEGQYIGLKGRLPVRIVGPVKKGQEVYVDDEGAASTEINGGSLVGVALESNNDEGEKLVECVLKV